MARYWLAAAMVGVAFLPLEGAPQGPAAPQQKMVRFGDVVLRDFARAELELGVVARAMGPSTHVDIADSERKTTALIHAREITAYLSKQEKQRSARRDIGRVERVEAVGSVRFAGVRNVDDGGPVNVQATGTKAIYDRTADRLTLEGPITFSADQPDASGNGKDTVRGKAKRAVYDAGKRILQLFEDVEATVITPDTPPEGSTFSGDEVTIDMSTQPYRVAISNPSLTGVITIKVREPEKQQKPEAKKK